MRILYSILILISILFVSCDNRTDNKNNMQEINQSFLRTDIRDIITSYTEKQGRHQNYLILFNPNCENGKYEKSYDYFLILPYKDSYFGREGGLSYLPSLYTVCQEDTIYISTELDILTNDIYDGDNSESLDWFKELSKGCLIGIDYMHKPRIITNRPDTFLIKKTYKFEAPKI